MIDVFIGLAIGSTLSSIVVYYVMISKAKDARSKALLEGSKDCAVLEERVSQLQTLLEEIKVQKNEKDKAFMEIEKQLQQSFEALSSKALKSNNQAFLDLAKSSFEHLQTKATSDIDKKHITLTEALKPLKESLDKVDNQYTHLEKSLSSNKSSFETQLKELSSQSQQLQSETRTLSMALKNPKVRGQWGEMGLKRVAELAGMIEHCDFKEQVSTPSEEGRKVPDMVIHLPNREKIVVDAKTPLASYMESLEANSEDNKELCLKNHASHLMKHVQDLSKKSYWDQFDSSPEFVVLYLPGDHLYSAALEINSSITEEAMAQGVVIATPSTLITLLKSAAYGWRQETLTESAEEIKNIGKDLYDRLAKFISHMRNLETHLGRSVKSYNDAVGSLETRILPSARKFEELGIQPKNKINSLKPVDSALREIRQIEKEN